jgi:predicted RNA methylase
MVSGGLTEIELISIALEKLQLRSSETFADIGCGTGSVSIAASKKARSLFSKIWDAKSNKCLMDGSQPRQSGSHFSCAPSFAI